MPELAAETGDTIPAMLDLRLSPAERRTFLALALGHVLFAVALFTVAGALGEYAFYWITPLFGLPYLVLGPRGQLPARAFVLLIGFAAVHYGAALLASKCFAVPFTGTGLTGEIWICGAIGGAAGAVASFALCRLCGLLRPGGWGMLAAGTLTLTVLGAIGLSLAFTGWDKDAVAPMLLLYTPWQLAFAWFLAKTLRG